MDMGKRKSQSLLKWVKVLLQLSLMGSGIGVRRGQIGGSGYSGRQCDVVILHARITVMNSIVNHRNSINILKFFLKRNKQNKNT